MRYTGPLRDEPLAIELHNTIYAAGGDGVDALADPEMAVAWLEALAPRLHHDALPPGAWPSATELVALRAGVRGALHAAAGDARADRANLDAINAASRRARRSPVAVPGAAAHHALGTDYGDASRADIVLATIAADAIDLLTGERRHNLRMCGAPRCVLMFLSDHPRREWCSNRCGNRARQARHYERHAGGRS